MPAVQKKTKAAISKAATQKKKVVAKVPSIQFRNGLREKSKKNPIMQSSLTKPPMIESSPQSLNSADISQPLT